MHYDYLIVGAGLFGAVFASEMKKRGKTSLVIDKRDHIAGNIYTKEWNDIHVHWYGAHIFHTSNKEIWDYVNQYAEFNHFVNSPVAVYGEELYNLPFNMNTFSRLWNVRTPKQAQEKIREQIANLHIEEPKNLEEQALSLVGTDVYEKLIKGYTEKQWGRDCKELPAFIIKRLPLRFTYDNNYFNDRYQGIPIGGYTKIVEKMLDGIPVILNMPYKEFIKKKVLPKAADIRYIATHEWGHFVSVDQLRDSKSIDELYQVMLQKNCDYGIIISLTSDFTKSAKDAINDINWQTGENILLIGPKNIVKLLEDNDYEINHKKLQKTITYDAIVIEKKGEK